MANYAIGIDIGGTNTKFGVVDKDGKILKQERLLTNEPDGVQDFIDALHDKLLPMKCSQW